MLRCWKNRKAKFFGPAYLLFCSAACAQGNQLCGFEVSKVALMFLARGGMPLEALWEPWFRSVAGVVPARYVQEQMCDSEEAASTNTMDCRVASAGDSLLHQQLLFSVYVHSSRQNFTDFDPSSVFKGTLLKDQGKAEWGDTTPAVKVLLAAALQERMNRVFVLLSDSDIPLYPAKLTYNQLIQEKLSRVDACHSYDYININRYTCALAEDGIDVHHWRKSNLFMVLIRKHAQLFRDEVKVNNAFRQKCSGVMYDDAIQEYRGCLTDEHYYASVLAAEKLSHETDCIGAITLANFTESVEGHPKLYDNADVQPRLLEALRETILWLPPGKCANETTHKTSQQAFVKLPLRSKELDCEEILRLPQMPLMDSVCHLFFRKFDKSAVPGLLRLMGSGSEKFPII